MPRVQSSGSTTAASQAATAQSLKRNQACHQCRKRKLKCNAQKPCATCAKSHRLAVAANPTLVGTEPECTFDEFTPENPPPPPEGPRAKYQRLENRINELEALLKEQATTKETSPGNLNTNILTPSSHASPPSITSLDPSPIFNSDLSGFLATSPPAGSHKSSDGPSPFTPSVPSPAIQASPSQGNEANQQIMWSDWPDRLPAPDLLHHLIEVFFTCYPHAYHLLHRPTFMASLAYSPKSPAFPHVTLLHAICAYASIFSYRIESPPISVVGGVFPDGKNKPNDSFAERHVRWSRQARDEATSVGSSLIECTQALVIMVGYFHLQGRWVELWASAGLALRYCVPLGLNNRPGFHTARTHPKTWLRNGGRSILPDADNAIEREQRTNLFWIAYAYERFQTAVGPWAMSLDDEDINQVFPCRLEDFELGNDVEADRQTMQTPHYLSTHPPEQTDSFALYVKAAVLLSKVKILTLRVGHRYPDIPDVRDTPAFRHLESTIAVFRSTFPPGYQEPIVQTSRGFDTQLYVAHLIPHTAIILMHEEHANIESPNCLSTQKSLLAARAILDLVYIVCSTSYDISRLPPVCTFCWFMAARVLVRVLKHKYQSGQRAEANTMRAEVEVIRLVFSRMGERIPLALRHGKMLEDLLNFDDMVYNVTSKDVGFNCTYEDIYDPAFIQENTTFDWPGPSTISATLVEVPYTTQNHDSTNTSGSLSSHIQTPDAGTLPDMVTDMGPILTDEPTSASATLQQLLQSMDSNSFLLSSGYGDLSQMPLF
ncbi:hypothetical protein BDV93DRAFT_148252 [Ceratobasidium sp. AG-I]|nr:hypothetical protein BDV93DRAFT_148252 [Ceratobasidium sp. AG-I]